jgi:hypothetical protein
MTTVEHPADVTVPEGDVTVELDTERHQVVRLLEPHYGSVAFARETTRDALRLWGMEAIFDDISLVVSELVTNALRHGLHLGPSPHDDTCQVSRMVSRSPFQEPNQSRPVGSPALEFMLAFTSSSLACAVRDPDLTPPTLRPLESDRGSGWGLHLVDSLTSSWGWAVLPAEGRATGKVVWALFSLPLMSGLTRGGPRRTWPDTSPARFSQRAEGMFPCGFDAMPGRAAPSWPHWPRLANPA